MRNLIFVALLLFVPPAFGADPALIIDILECESAGRYNVVGDDGVSFGIAQFQKTTFDTLKRKARMPWLNWKNPIHQMRLLNWALDNGYGKHWTCYGKVMKRRRKSDDIESISSTGQKTGHTNRH